MARPTKYSEDILKQTQDYLENFREHGDIIPSVAGLSLVLDIAKSTIYEWEKHEDKEEFSDTLRKINAKQEKLLLENGLLSEWNSTIVKLALANHGYADSTKNENKNDGKLDINIKRTIHKASGND